MDVRVSDKNTGNTLGTISREELQFLVDQLEEESSRDTDYFIDQATIDLLTEAGASEALVSLLQSAVGTSDGIDIVWQIT